MIDLVAKTAISKPVFSSPREVTEILSGEAVLKLLEDIKFQDEWDQLYDNCPWATVFQSRSFVAPWYQLYGKELLPVLVKTEYGGKLTGLFTLTIDKKGVITGAGLGVAEYQVWLTADVKDGAFIKKALAEIRKQFPRNNILVRYLPAGVSFNWTKKDPAWRKYCFIKAFSDPLMLINEAHFTAELKKKNRKEKVNRLKRMGELKFERITSFAAFASIFDELATQFDFRKGARYNKVILRNDPLRKNFLFALFEQGILHITVLKVNDKIIASNVGIGGKNQLHLQGINTHSPEFAKYSPGIIHFLLLGKLLAEEAIEVFDLTPGEDAYKEILATDHTQVYTLQVGNRYCRFSNQLKSGLTGYVKKTAARAGINTDARKKLQRDIKVYKEKIITIVKQGHRSLLPYLFGRFRWRKKTQRCWHIPTTPLHPVSGLLPVQKDDLNHLLDFKRLERVYTRQEFLADAMRRFEEGGHCYSWAENGVLLACAWTGNPKFSIAEYGHTITPGEQPVVLRDLYYHPKERERLPVFLQSIAAKAVLDDPHASTYIVTNADNHRIFDNACFKAVF